MEAVWVVFVKFRLFGTFLSVLLKGRPTVFGLSCVVLMFILSLTSESSDVSWNLVRTDGKSTYSEIWYIRTVSTCTVKFGTYGRWVLVPRNLVRTDGKFLYREIWYVRTVSTCTLKFGTYVGKSLYREIWCVRTSSPCSVKYGMYVGKPLPVSWNLVRTDVKSLYRKIWYVRTVSPSTLKFCYVRR